MHFLNEPKMMQQSQHARPASDNKDMPWRATPNCCVCVLSARTRCDVLHSCYCCLCTEPSKLNRLATVTCRGSYAADALLEVGVNVTATVQGCSDLHGNLTSKCSVWGLHQGQECTICQLSLQWNSVSSAVRCSHLKALACMTHKLLHTCSCTNLVLVPPHLQPVQDFWV
jgi:hypothetical protein